MQWIDAKGVTWVARMTIGLAMELKDQGIDLLNPDQLAKIYADPIQFLKLAAKLHKASLEENGVAEIDLMDLMTETAEVAEKSLQAVEAALVDFFHRVRGGKPLAAVLTRASEAAAKTADAQVAMIQGDKGEKAMQSLIDGALKPLADKLEQLGSPAPTGAASGQQPES